MGRSVLIAGPVIEHQRLLGESALYDTLVGLYSVLARLTEEDILTDIIRLMSHSHDNLYLLGTGIRPPQTRS